nr:MAG TPA: hypothetical protein [Caudoviricetes sp.]
MYFIFDMILLLIVGLICYISIISITRLYMSIKYGNKLEEYRKRLLEDDEDTIILCQMQPKQPYKS